MNIKEMSSTQQQKNQYTRHGRREFRGGTFRLWSLLLSVYALVLILTATNVDDHSSRGRSFKDFMEGFSSFSNASLNKQTSNASTVISEPTQKIKVNVQVTQTSQVLALKKLAAAEAAGAAAKSKALLQKMEQALSERKQEAAAAPVEYINNFTFPAHGCLVNTVGERVHCHFHNLRINKTKISAGQMGGEPLNSVIGQDESMEYLSYQNGSFVLQSTLDPPGYPPSGWHQYYYYMKNVLEAIEYENTTSTTTCDQVFVGLTLFITRYEYVNLYHALTDWWNAYYSLPIDKRMTDNNTKDVGKKVNVVFLDAHPEGNLDHVWDQLFGKVTFVRHLPSENTCFEEARFVPTGYTSPLFPRYRSISKSEQHAGDFVEHVLNVYNLSHVRRIPGHVVVIERVPYISHPRSKPSQTQRILGNIRELALKLPSLLFPNVTVEVVTLVNDTMRDQIAAIRRADILVANHGAGLTHLLFLDANAQVVELGCNRGFFPELAKGFFPELANWRRDIHYYCQPATEGMNISNQYWHQHVVSVVRQAVLGKDSETM